MKKIILGLLLFSSIGYTAAKITNADIATSAAIARSKLAALTASRVMVTDGSGFDSASSITSTTLGFLDATSSVQTQLDAKQSLDSDLTALAGNSTDGFWAHTGSGTGSARTLTAPAAGITISNPAGIAGNPTFALANDLAALEALSGTNTLYYRSGTDTWSAVTVSADLTFSGGVLSVSNPVASAISALNIDWSQTRANGGVFTKTLGANSTFTFSNKIAGQTIVVRLTNTASNYTVTWPTVTWKGGSAPVMTTGASSDFFTFIYDGTTVYGAVAAQFF